VNSSPPMIAITAPVDEKSVLSRFLGVFVERQ
jgi:hypothetical protein